MAKDTPLNRPVRSPLLFGAEPTDPGSGSTSLGRGVEQANIEFGDKGDLLAIGPYRVSGVLGRGGMGVVYEAKDLRRPGERFALKTIEARYLDVSDHAAIHRFRHEICALERLLHPGVVRLYEFGFATHPLDYEIAYYVMEKLEGLPLVQAMSAEHAMPVDDALTIAHGLAEAIGYLDDNGILHRDIKPANVFLEKSGRVVLLDFGLARSEEFTRLTLAGQIVGTFAYMSPERLAGMKVDAAADVFAVGVVLFQLLTGQHPFGTGNPAELMALIHAGIQWPSSFGALEHAESLRGLLGAMLAVDPNRRPRPRALAERLLELIEPTGPSEHTGPFRAQGSGPTPLGPVSNSSPAVTVVAEAPVSAPASAASLASAASFASAASPAPPKPTPLPAARLEFVEVLPETLVPSMSSAIAASVPPLIHPQDPTKESPPLPVRRGPSWPLVWLLVGSFACLAFTAGLLIGVRRPPASHGARGYGSAEDALKAGAQAREAGDHRLAIEALESALELSPSFAEAHRELGQVHRALGDNDRATQHFRLYLALRPDAPDRALVQAAVRSLEEHP